MTESVSLTLLGGGEVKIDVNGGEDARGRPWRTKGRKKARKGEKRPNNPDEEDSDSDVEESFNKILGVFGDSNTLPIMEFAVVVNRLESNTYLNTLNNVSSRKSDTVDAVNVDDPVEKVKLLLENPAFMSLNDYKMLQNNQSPEAIEIIKYLKMIEEGKKMFKWPPPWFILSLTAVQMILFLVMHFHVGGFDVNAYLQFEP
jgi:hypothetical protein